MKARHVLSVGLVTALVGNFEVSAQLSRDINTYSLFAFDGLSFQGVDGSIGGVINSGNVGVNGIGLLNNAARLSLDGGGNSVFVANGTQVAGDTAIMQSDVSVYTLYVNSLSGGSPPVIRSGGTNTFAHATATEAIIAASNLPTLPSFSPGTLGVTNGTTLTLAPGSYGNVRENDNGILNLQAGTYYLNSLSAGKNVHINAVNGTVVYIAETLTLNNNCTIGATGAVFAARSDGNPQYTIKFSQDTVAYGQFFAPNGNLNLGGDSIVSGQFWADVISGDKGDTVNFVTVPEPASLGLVALGLLGVLALRHHR